MISRLSLARELKHASCQEVGQVGSGKGSALVPGDTHGPLASEGPRTLETALAVGDAEVSPMILVDRARQ
jgi:hypothetical protein